MTNDKQEQKQTANFANIHIIPFDLGFMFYDVYTPSYRGNYYLWQEFLKKLLKLQNGKDGQVLDQTLEIDKNGLFYKKVDKELWMHKKHKKVAFSIVKDYKIKFKRKENGNIDIEYKPILLKDKKNPVECNYILSKKILGDKNKAKYLTTFDECLCEIKLEENLYCFILKSGLAVFVVGCFDNEGLTDYINSKVCGDAVKMRFQNEIINRAVLLDELNKDYSNLLKFEGDDTKIFTLPKKKCWLKRLFKWKKYKQEYKLQSIELKKLIAKDDDLISSSEFGQYNGILDNVISEKRNKMILFKIWCWKTIQQIVKNIKECGGKSWSCKRPHSSKPFFSQFGFSLSSNFIINPNFDSEKDQKVINYLQDRSISYENLGKPDTWTKAEKHYKEVSYLNTPEENINTQLSGDAINVPPLNIVKTRDFKISFSSNTICIQPTYYAKRPDDKITSIDKFLQNNELTDLLFAEIDIITKWFNADNCIANDIEKEFTGIEGLQTIQGQIEYYSAELDNPTSSKIESLYLMYRKRIVETTKVKELYNSISQEIQILKSKKIEQVNNAANDREKFSRVIRLLIDIFIAGFTGAGMAKTIIDVQRGAYRWWEAFAFGAVIVLFVLGRGALAIADKVKDSKKQKDLKKR